MFDYNLHMQLTSKKLLFALVAIVLGMISIGLGLIIALIVGIDWLLLSGFGFLLMAGGIFFIQKQVKSVFSLFQSPLKTTKRVGRKHVESKVKR